MSWHFQPVLGSAEKAALSGEKNIVYVSPPAMWTLRPLLDRLPESGGDSLETIVLVPDLADALELNSEFCRAGVLAPTHPVTALARSLRVLRSQAARTLIATPSDLLALLKSAAPGLRDARRVIIWCTDVLLDEGESETLDTILAEFREKQRIIHVAGEVPQQFVERHARRAPVIREADGPTKADAAVRYALVPGNGVSLALRQCLDVIDPASAIVWDPGDRLAEDRSSALPGVEVSAQPAQSEAELAVTVELPSVSVIDLLNATAPEVVALIRPSQLPYLTRICRKLKPVKLPSEADRARDRAAAIRRDVRERITSGGDEAGGLRFALNALEPLFFEHDPALVAAAVASSMANARTEPDPAEEYPSWVKVFLSIGKKDGLTVRDVVGAILNSTGLSRDTVGKVEIRDSFTLVELPPAHTAAVVSELNGSTLKGRRLTARVDRKGQSSR